MTAPAHGGGHSVRRRLRSRVWFRVRGKSRHALEVSAHFHPRGDRRADDLFRRQPHLPTTESRRRTGRGEGRSAAYGPDPGDTRGYAARAGADARPHRGGPRRGGAFRDRRRGRRDTYPRRQPGPRGSGALPAVRRRPPGQPGPGARAAEVAAAPARGRGPARREGFPLAHPGARSAGQPRRRQRLGASGRDRLGPGEHPGAVRRRLRPPRRRDRDLSVARAAVRYDDRAQSPHRRGRRPRDPGREAPGRRARRGAAGLGPDSGRQDPLRRARRRPADHGPTGWRWR